MKDWEVGEAWRDCPDHTKTCAFCTLIRKLVEERAERYSIEACGKTRSWWWDKFPVEYTNHALRDFGIDPAEWKE